MDDCRVLKTRADCRDKVEKIPKNLQASEVIPVGKKGGKMPKITRT